MTSPVILLHADMVLASKVKEAAKRAAISVVPFRDLDTMSLELQPERKVLLIIDLNSQKLSIPSAIKAAYASSRTIQDYCFYSHVNPELGEEARMAGAQNIVTRSKFSVEIDKIVEQFAQQT